MTWVCHNIICKYITIHKYLKTGNFVKFLSVKIRISRKLSLRQDQAHSSNQLYMPEPDFKKRPFHLESPYPREALENTSSNLHSEH